MMFQPDTKKFPEVDKEWKLPHMTRPKQITIFKASAPRNCSSPRTSGPRNKNLQSTNNAKSEVEIEEDSDFYPDTESVKNNELCATIIPFNINRQGFSDLTGAFPHK